MRGGFSHFDGRGRSRMVAVEGKDATVRKARAAGFLRMASETVEKLRAGQMPKGDPFETAKVAGIMAAKRAWEAIPMCHPLLVTFVDIRLSLRAEGVHIESEVRCKGETGVEMEALTAVAVAGLTVYDMCKAADKGMVLEKIRLLEKTGGRSGAWISPELEKTPALAGGQDEE